MMLCDHEIFKRVMNESMVTGYLDLHTQIQTNGMDLTLNRAASISAGSGPATLDFSNVNRAIPNFLPIEWTSEGVFLEPGDYLFRSAETLTMPNDVAALCFPRSSLSRCGAFLDSAVVDAGYQGLLEFPVRLVRPVRFLYRARFVQVVFIRLDDKPEKLYNGIYKKAT